MAALHPARQAAYPAGEFVGQESFMRADEIRQLAARAGIGPGVSVLDLCCGVAGPGRLIASEFGCDYRGVDGSGSAVAIARHMAGDLPCVFEQARLPPLPGGRFDVVLLLETMLAFADKIGLIRAVASALVPGGRFACTVEAGRPLSSAERADMPDADTVWLIELTELTQALSEAGLGITWQLESTAAHAEMAQALLQSFRRHSAQIARGIGAQAVAELIAAHELWADWLGARRVRKYAVVAEKR
jgi:SAM-dependent methyltransferase